MITTISIIIMALLLAALIWAGYYGFKTQFKWISRRDKVYENIANIKTIDDWKRSKQEVTEVLSDYYKKEYVERKTTGSLYGKLAEKAEELLSKK